MAKPASPLRRGFTTGTCAAAAAGAAARMLLSGTVTNEIGVTLPGGERLLLPVVDAAITGTAARCAVVKDSGDDPDITNGISVYAEVTLQPEGIGIAGGEGIGTVTKPGLDQPVGAAAINSVPRRMIGQALRAAAEAFGYEGGFRAVISVPGGAVLAAKTFNPRMGIEGGISIIGTTGIVEPMSTAALLETVRLEARQKQLGGERILLLTLGNYGEQFMKRSLPALSGREVMCSNYIGEALDMGISLGFEGILLIGHIGKLVKLGSGIFNTHSAVADGRMETLMTCGILAGADPAVLRQLPDCVTVDAALSILEDAGCRGAVLEILMQRIDRYLRARVKDALPVGAVVFSQKSELYAQTAGAADLLEQIGKEQDHG